MGQGLPELLVYLGNEQKCPAAYKCITFSRSWCFWQLSSVATPLPHISPPTPRQRVGPTGQCATGNAAKSSQGESCQEQPGGELPKAAR